MWTPARRPLSPYLFLLVAETLQQLIKANQNLIIHPIDDGYSCPVLQYADDTLIVVCGDSEDVANLKMLLDLFADATGLKINYNKSTVVLIHMSEHSVQQCIYLLGCKREGFPQVYLGLPLSVHKLPASVFKPQIDKADRYLAGWQSSLLNYMGRAVLVNAVLDSQLVYAMSALSEPVGAVTKMDSRRRSFLWNGDNSASPAQSLIAWERVCLSKEQGGLGIKNLGPRTFVYC